MNSEEARESRSKLPIIVQLELRGWDHIQAGHFAHRYLYRFRKGLCTGDITPKDYVDQVWEIVKLPREFAREFAKDPKYAAHFPPEKEPLVLDTRIFREAAEALYRHREFVLPLRSEYLGRIRDLFQRDLDEGLLHMESIRKIAEDIARDIQEPESVQGMLPDPRGRIRQTES